MVKGGQSGIGTLIIFIAMLLVAAVAAGVLIQTTGSLQNKALVTGSQAQSQISTHLDVLSLTGTNGTSNSTIENLQMIVRLAAGSDTIDLNDVTTTVDTSSASETKTFASYTVTYLQNGTGHKDNYVVMGDVVKISFALATEVGEGAKIKINLIPKIGIPTVVESVTPEIMTDYLIHLYP